MKSIVLAVGCGNLGYGLGAGEMWNVYAGLFALGCWAFMATMDVVYGKEVGHDR